MQFEMFSLSQCFPVFPHHVENADMALGANQKKIGVPNKAVHLPLPKCWGWSEH